MVRSSVPDTMTFTFDLIAGGEMFVPSLDISDDSFYGRCDMVLWHLSVSRFLAVTKHPPAGVSRGTRHSAFVEYCRPRHQNILLEAETRSILSNGNAMSNGSILY